MAPTPTTRAELVTLLQRAAELEHQLLCAYLFTAYTLKQELAEGGLTEDQLAAARTWRGKITGVAVQEMLHLALASNMLTAVSADACAEEPYFARQNLPLSPGDMRKLFGYNTNPSQTEAAWLDLWSFDASTIAAYVWFESFEDEVDFPGPTWHGPTQLQAAAAATSTLVEIYEAIATAFVTLEPDDGKPLFCGRPERQLTDAQMTPIFGKGLLSPVVDTLSGLRAINTIILQGEGDTDAWQTFLQGLDVPGTGDLPTSAGTSHHEIFSKLAEDLRVWIGAPGYEPARAIDAAFLSHPQDDTPDAVFARDLSALFDEIYGVMLGLLWAAFRHDTDGTCEEAEEYERQTLVQLALRAMIYVLSPLGNTLTQVPTGATTALGHPLYAAPRFRFSAQSMTDMTWDALTARLAKAAASARACLDSAPCERLDQDVWLTPAYLAYVPPDGPTTPHGTVRRVLEDFLALDLTFMSERMQRVRDHAPPPSSSPNNVCMGLNDCKGLDIAGDAAVAGAGVCATASPHVCSTLNDCRHEGGCGFTPAPATQPTLQDHPGDNACTGQGACGSPVLPSIENTYGLNTPGEAYYDASGDHPAGAGSVWRFARIRFEERMKAEGKGFGASDGPGDVGKGDFPGWTPG